jgi:hypothetical protein
VMYETDLKWPIGLLPMPRMVGRRMRPWRRVRSVLFHWRLVEPGLRMMSGWWLRLNPGSEKSSLWTEVSERMAEVMEGRGREVSGNRAREEGV